MYDTIRFWIDGTKVKDTLSFVPYLDKWDTAVDDSTGSIKYSFGNYKNMRIIKNERGISLEGSIAKYYNNNNLQNFTFKDVKDAINNLSSSLNLNLLTASITRIDIGYNIELSNPTTQYLRLLGACEKHTKSEYVNKDTESISYISSSKRQNRLRELVFYDKIRESRAKGENMPITALGANLMRYELRLTARLPQQLKKPRIEGEMLFQETFYKLMIEQWVSWYSKVAKIVNVKLTDMSNIKTVTQAFDALVAYMCANTDPALIEHFQNTLKEQKVFDDPKYYSRLKKKLKGINTNCKLVDSHDLMAELDAKIKDISNNAL